MDAVPRLVALVLGVIAAGVGAAHAQPSPCPARVEDWRVSQGDLQPGRACGSYIAASNGASIAYSFAQITWRQPVTLPYRVTVTWRRLGSDTRSLELHLLGAVVLIFDHKIAMWVDDATFGLDGWHALPGYRTRAAHTVSVVQRVDGLEVEVDGRPVRRWRFAPEQTTDRISVAFKGQRGTREKVWFRDFAVEPLGPPPAQRQSPATSPARPK